MRSAGLHTEYAMDRVTNLHLGILSDQDQALDALWRLHRHYSCDLSPKAVAEDMSFFNIEGIHCAQYSFSHLSPVELGPSR